MRKVLAMLMCMLLSFVPLSLAQVVESGVVCSNGVRDEVEADMDCGGACGVLEKRCATGQDCMVDADCTTNTCYNGKCKRPARESKILHYQFEDTVEGEYHGGAPVFVDTPYEKMVSTFNYGQISARVLNEINLNLERREGVSILLGSATNVSVYSKALVFDGVDDDVSCGTLSLASGVTITARVLFEAGGGDQYVVAIGDKDSFAISRDGESKRLMYKAGSRVVKGPLLADGVFYDIIAIYDTKEPYVNILVNGLYSRIPSVRLDPGMLACMIGAHPSGAGRLRGQVDDVAIYNEALDPKELPAEFGISGGLYTYGGASVCQIPRESSLGGEDATATLLRSVDTTAPVCEFGAPPAPEPPLPPRIREQGVAGEPPLAEEARCGDGLCSAQESCIADSCCQGRVTDLASSSHCGACGRACSTGESCNEGSCVAPAQTPPPLPVSRGAVASTAIPQEPAVREASAPTQALPPPPEPSSCLAPGKSDPYVFPGSEFCAPPNPHPSCTINQIAPSIFCMAFGECPSDVCGSNCPLGGSKIGCRYVRLVDRTHYWNTLCSGGQVQVPCGGDSCQQDGNTFRWTKRIGGGSCDPNTGGCISETVLCATSLERGRRCANPYTLEVTYHGLAGCTGSAGCIFDESPSTKLVSCLGGCRDGVCEGGEVKPGAGAPLAKPSMYTIKTRIKEIDDELKKDISVSRRRELTKEKWRLEAQKGAYGAVAYATDELLRNTKLYGEAADALARVRQLRDRVDDLRALKEILTKELDTPENRALAARAEQEILKANYDLAVAASQTLASLPRGPDTLAAAVGLLNIQTDSQLDVLDALHQQGLTYLTHILEIDPAAIGSNLRDVVSFQTDNPFAAVGKYVGSVVWDEKSFIEPAALMTQNIPDVRDRIIENKQALQAAAALLADKRISVGEFMKGVDAGRIKEISPQISDATAKAIADRVNSARGVVFENRANPFDMFTRADPVTGRPYIGIDYFERKQAEAVQAGVQEVKATAIVAATTAATVTTGWAVPILAGRLLQAAPLAIEAVSLAAQAAVYQVYSTELTRAFVTGTRPPDAYSVGAFATTAAMLSFFRVTGAVQHRFETAPTAFGALLRANPFASELSFDLLAGSAQASAQTITQLAARQGAFDSAGGFGRFASDLVRGQAFTAPGTDISEIRRALYEEFRESLIFTSLGSVTLSRADGAGVHPEVNAKGREFEARWKDWSDTLDAHAYNQAEINRVSALHADDPSLPTLRSYLEQSGDTLIRKTTELRSSEAGFVEASARHGDLRGIPLARTMAEQQRMDASVAQAVDRLRAGAQTVPGVALQPSADALFVAAREDLRSPPPLVVGRESVHRMARNAESTIIAQVATQPLSASPHGAQQQARIEDLARRRVELAQALQQEGVLTPNQIDRLNVQAVRAAADARRSGESVHPVVAEARVSQEVCG